jgi:type II secretory pathway component PulC
VAVGQTVTLTVVGVDRYSIGAPDIADVRVDPSNRANFLISGKVTGTTSFVLIHKDGSQRSYDVVTSLHSADIVSKELAVLLLELPSVHVMRSGPRFVLHGVVRRDEDLKRVQNAAGLYGSQVTSIVVLEK